MMHGYMSEPKLKPCPFCGYEFPTLLFSNSGGFYFVTCENCDTKFRLGAGKKERIKERIVDAWNRRAHDEKAD